MIQNILKIPLEAIDRFFVWTYGSKLNPLQRSGALLVGLLLAVLISGFYLIFFYSVSNPHASMQEIQSQWYLGRWIRSFHRYASDLAVVVVCYHSMAMLIQGRAWGSRALAWLSGVFLMCALFVSGWTGFVMVWDQHGQAIAQEGSRLMQLIPFLREDLMSAFSGENPIPGSFYFMNLFLHVAVPLGMVFGLWVHVTRMGKVKIFPDKTCLKLTVGTLMLLSLAIPAPLLEKGDLKRIIHEIPYDIWFNFFLTISKKLSPASSATLIAIGLFIMCSAVYWSSPNFKLNRSFRPHLPPFNEVRPLVLIRSFVVSAVLLSVLAYGSQISLNMNNEKAAVRFNFHFLNRSRENCHVPTAQERVGTLAHMQKLEICDEADLIHNVRILINDKLVDEKVFSKIRKDLRNYRAQLYHKVEPGLNHVEMRVEVQNLEHKTLQEYVLNENFDIQLGQIQIINFNKGFK